jgi:drug/metabolite transporter (DMT)-like permease
MYLGILAGLTTCALWGLTFVAPRAIAPFSAFDLAAARYGVFGVTCILLMLNRRFRPTGLPIRLWISGILLGSVGYAGYFLLVSFAVKDAGAVIPPLITGLMPVLLPIIANLRENALPWRALALPLSMVVIGLVVAYGCRRPLRHERCPVGDSRACRLDRLWDRQLGDHAPSGCA